MELRWEPGHVESDGERIYFEVSQGRDPVATVVLNHGGRGSHAVWYQQVAEFASRYRVITWDCRGFGRSTLHGGQVSVDSSVADLVAVLDTVGVNEAVHLVGQSMGGLWLTGFAFAHRERIASLVYTNTLGGLFDAQLDAVYATAIEDQAASLATARASGLFELGFSTVTGRRLLETHVTQAFLYQELGTLSPVSDAGALGALSRQRFDARTFRELGVPALVIGSTDDPYVPSGLPRAVAERMGARYIEIEDAGHSTYFEKPQEWNDAVLTWLAEQSGHAPGSSQR
ncbi:MAG: alpha/beta fold hydrolase [Acidimicrobiia bacterium]